MNRRICSRLIRELLWKKLASNAGEGEDMHHVVAVVGHQNGILLVQIEDVAQRVFLLSQEAECFHVADQRLAVTVRQCGMRRVGHGAQQVLVEVEDARQ